MAICAVVKCGKSVSRGDAMAFRWGEELFEYC